VPAGFRRGALVLEVWPWVLTSAPAMPWWSHAWWRKLLVAGDEFVKVDNVDDALARVERIVAKQGKITIKSN
jgi:hypothetical protein